MGRRPNSREAQVYRYLAQRVGKTVHVDALARHLGLPVDDKGIQKARRPIYDLINQGEIELETLSGGGVWKVVAVIDDSDAGPTVREEPAERDDQEAGLALADSHPPQVAAPTTVTYAFVGQSQDGAAPIVRDSEGRVYRLVRI